MDIVKQVEDGKRKYIRLRKPAARALFTLEQHPKVKNDPELKALADKLHKAMGDGDKFGSRFFGTVRIRMTPGGGIGEMSGGDGK